MNSSNFTFDPAGWRQAFGDVRDGFWGELYSQRSQVFVWVPVFFGLGIAVYFSLKFEPPLWFGAAGGVFACGLCWWLRFTSARYVLLFLLCFSAGFLCASLRTDSVYTPILYKKMAPVDVEGVIEKLEYSPEGKGVRVTLREVFIEGIEAHETPVKVRIKFRKSHELSVGQRVKVLAGLSPPSGPLLPGGFDFQRYMFFQGVGAVGFAYGGPEVLSTPVRNSFHKYVQNLRAAVSLSVIERLGEVGGVASALMVGERSTISEGDRDAMRHSGLAHMLAISGLHVGLFFGFVFFLTRLFLVSVSSVGLKYPVKKYAAVLGMFGAVFYMIIAGSTIPTQRAVLMTGVVFVAILIDRTPLSMRLVAFSALVILIIAPESLLSVSFQMSFAAVGALVAFYSFIKPLWSKLHKGKGFLRRAGLYLLGVSMTTVVATFATAPFALFHFQSLAVYSLLANILAMPVLAFVVMPFVVLFFILLPLGVGGIAIDGLGFGVRIIVDIAHYVSGLDHAVMYSSQWSTGLFLLLSSGFLLLILIEGRLRFLSIAPLALFFVLVFQLQQPDILISSSSKLVAIKDQSGSLSFSNLGKERFTRAQWLQGFGASDNHDSHKWPKEGMFEDLNCGEGGCRFYRDGYKISFLQNLGFFEEECQWADLIISSDPAPKCSGKTVVDPFLTKRQGAFSIYIHKDGLNIYRSEVLRGIRPWVRAAQKD